MQQIENGVLTTLIVAGRGIDSHSALHLQRRTVIPNLAQVAVGHLVHLIQIALVALLVAYDEDVGKRDDVAVHIDIGRVLHARHTVDIEGIAVHLRSQLIGGIAPHTVLALHKLGHTRSIVLAIARNVHGLGGQEIASHLDFDGLGGIKIKGHSAVRVDDGRLYAGTVEEFLLCRYAEANHCQSHHEN